MKRWRVFVLAFAMASVSGCTTTPANDSSATANTPDNKQDDLNTVYAKLGQEGGKLFTLDPQASTVRIYAFRGGSAAKLGHNHVLSAPQFIGFFHLPTSGANNARFDLTFRLDQLEIDNATYRASLGQAFAKTVTPEEIEGTRQHMLGADGLQAEQYPIVRIHSLQISGEAPKFAARIQVEMHGQSREMWIPLNVGGLPDTLAVTGSFVLRQTDFGAKPYSVLGGILAVQDELVIEFQLHGK